MTLNQLSEAHNVALSTTDRPDTMDTKANQRLQREAEAADARRAYGWPTSRCYPRTMREAFPNDIENAQWWYPPEQRTRDKVFFWLSVALWIGLTIYLWKTK